MLRHLDYTVPPSLDSKNGGQIKSLHSSDLFLFNGLRIWRISKKWSFASVHPFSFLNYKKIRIYFILIFFFKSQSSVEYTPLPHWYSNHFTRANYTYEATKYWRNCQNNKMYPSLRTVQAWPPYTYSLFSWCSSTEKCFFISISNFQLTMAYV